MDDLRTLDEAWDAPAAPTHEDYARARAALLARARPVEVASAAVLERAAAAAERQPFTPPRDDQWIYLEDRISGLDGGPMTRRLWRRADGGAIASLEDGKLKIDRIEKRARSGLLPFGPFSSYRELAALPADPDQLLRSAYELAGHITGAGATDHGDVYAIFNGMLRENLLPPELLAAIFRALKQVPGVTVERVDVSGRPALALGQTETWLREEMLLDEETLAYRGERSTVVRDATIDPAKAGNATGEVKKGEKVIAERIAAAVVDEPGDRP